MAKQKTHDRKVKEIARALKNIGYCVKASVGVYSRPGIIGDKYMPDIVAKNPRTGRVKIVEVKLGKELKNAKDELLTMFRKAKKQRKTDFELVITNPKRSK
jgi:hypothetical protein